MMPMSRKARHFWPLLLTLFLADCATKDLVVEKLGVDSAPQPVIDSLVRFNLAYNPGTAFSFDLRPYLGDGARWVMIGLIIVLIGALIQLYRRMSGRSRVAGIALGLACGGALGNLYDRLRFPAGVVDFIDVGIGVHRFYVFNVADAGITIGAVLLRLLFLREDGVLAPDIGRRADAP